MVVLEPFSFSLFLFGSELLPVRKNVSKQKQKNSCRPFYAKHYFPPKNIALFSPIFRAPLNIIFFCTTQYPFLQNWTAVLLLCVCPQCSSFFCFPFLKFALYSWILRAVFWCCSCIIILLVCIWPVCITSRALVVVSVLVVTFCNTILPYILKFCSSSTFVFFLFFFFFFLRLLVIFFFNWIITLSLDVHNCMLYKILDMESFSIFSFSIQTLYIFDDVLVVVKSAR